jgi:hypothetical protein
VMPTVGRTGMFRNQVEAMTTCIQVENGAKSDVRK